MDAVASPHFQSRLSSSAAEVEKKHVDLYSLHSMVTTRVRRRIQSWRGGSAFPKPLWSYLATIPKLFPKKGVDELKDSIPRCARTRI
jgi:hypothetical protein